MPHHFGDSRLLLIDMTPIHGNAATSTLKHAFFSDWSADALLHVHALSETDLGLNPGAGESRRCLASLEKANALIETFRPEVILYRPVDDRPMLHQFAMNAIAASPAPLVMWMMDDWPERLREYDPIRFESWDADLRALFSRSVANFAISEGMAKAFSKRYGAPFGVAHNGVVAADWPTRKRPSGKRVSVRYAGSLAPDTTRDSVLTAARAVSRLAAEGRPIIFEGRTQEYWLDQFGKIFNDLPSVSMQPADMTMEAYRQWLADADIILIAYNFDDATRRYLRYSFANKTPEALAAGAAIIAFGPGELESITVLAESDAAAVVTQDDPEALAAALRGLADDPDKRARMGAAGRKLAFSRFNLDDLRGRMKRALCVPARRPGAFDEEAPREEKAQFDECRFVFEILGAWERAGVMIDVGAHQGGALSPFAKTGWSIRAFEPDPKNRTILKRRFGHNPRVRISPCAVGANAQKNAILYSSDVSSGISTLTPFHESHVQGVRVDVVTLDQFIKENAITAVDFLKIDAEGHEMDVLEGIDFARLKPRVIVAEFEDAKTRARGYATQDLIDFISEAGYVVYVSEWHAIEEYGLQHSWRRLRRHPCDIAPDAWGNLIAFAEDPPSDSIEAAFVVARQDGSAGGGALATIDMIADAPPRPTYRKVASWFWRNHPKSAGVLRAAMAPVLKLVR